MPNLIKRFFFNQIGLP